MHWLKEFWLPIPCALCGQPPKAICQTCCEDFPWRSHPVTRPKSLPISGFAASDFEGVVMELVHQFKRTGSLALARFMAERMAVELSHGSVSLSADEEQGAAGLVLAGVPSRPDSFRRRGFVPAALLAKALAHELQRLGVPASVFNGVRLNRKVVDQALLNLQQRSVNLAGAITMDSPNRTHLARRLVLIDDVVTTGATIGEMYRAATAAGWNCNFFVSFAETL